MKRSTIIMLALGVCMMMAFTSEPSKTTEDKSNTLSKVEVFDPNTILVGSEITFTKGDVSWTETVTQDVKDKLVASYYKQFSKTNEAPAGCIQMCLSGVLMCCIWVNGSYHCWSYGWLCEA